MAKILVLGGTGAMGVYLVPELVRLGHEVDVTSRAPGKCGDSVRYLTGNARDLDFLRSVAGPGRYDAVFDFMVYGTEEFRERHDFLLGLSGHYFFVSSYRVFADAGSGRLTERSPRLVDVSKDAEYLATDEYALAKGRQEDLLRDAKKGNWTILRPGITYSRNRFQLGTLEANTICFRGFQGVPVVMAREILERATTMTWAGDVAAMMGGLTRIGGIQGDDFNLVSSESHTWREVAGIYEKVIGLRVVETDLSSYERVAGGKYQIRLDRMLDRRLDNSKVLRATGLKQEELMPLMRGLPKELASFRSSPEYRYFDAALQVRMDKLTRSRISLETLPQADRSIYVATMFPWRSRVRSVAARVRRKLRSLVGSG